jgi:molybdenum cofactor cytidylyltransferase
MKVTGIILAAGLGSRMGGNKMSALYKGVPMVQAVIMAAKASNLHDIFIITGFETIETEVKTLHNPDYSTGLASSLKVGLSAVKTEGAMILLGDMPLITPFHINTLITSFRKTSDIIVPICNGEQGNPVLWGCEHFAQLLTLEGDSGAKSLLRPLRSFVKHIHMDNAILRDFDTKESLIL